MKTQLHLQSETYYRTCWVDYDERVKVGSQITLKGFAPRRGIHADQPERFWTVLYVGQIHKTSDIKMDWNVGGVKSRR